MDSEISGLEDKHAFLKLGNHVARFSFLYSDLPRTQKAFVPRPLEDDELAFDPKTLKPKRTRLGEGAATDTEQAKEDPANHPLEDDIVTQGDNQDDVPEADEEDEDERASLGHFDRSGF